MLRHKRKVGLAVIAITFAFKEQFSEENVWWFIGFLLFGMVLSASPSRPR